jgi:hypothetical protein
LFGDWRDSSAADRHHIARLHSPVLQARALAAHKSVVRSKKEEACVRARHPGEKKQTNKNNH